MLLAAGMGRRMGKYTAECTKCMVEVGEQTLIERVVEALQYANIDKLIMVVGYEAERLKGFIETKKFPIKIEYVYNYDYETTNNIYSLFLAKEYLKKDDTILLESDLVFDKELIKNIVLSREENLVVVAKYEQWMDGTVVVLDNKQHISDFVDKSQFQYKDVEKYYKTVNIYKLSKNFIKNQYLPFLEAYLQAYGTNQYYEQVLKILAHIRSSELKAYILNDEKWYEIDDAQDLDIASTIFASDEKILEKYEYHFGGYWRFPKVKDFCYLVNPYYPPKKMLDQMKYFYNDLILQYPSGMNIQRMNAESMFGVDEKYLLVGNGAAELVAVLGKLVTGKMTINIPTFNEYKRCFTKCEFRVIDNSLYNYSFSKEHILKEIESTDTLLIVNPDNPSGAFLKYEEIIEILDKCKAYKVRCIIDESFIDFADEEIRYTLLEEKLLERYKELVVIKSISKSYGIPGLRLGIMACSDVAFLKKVQRNMAVWNINSFAEYYLQIQRLYKKSYTDACNKIAQQRTWLKKELSNINGIKVYPSQANYIMCEVEAEVNSVVLATRLVKEYDILIKNLSKKQGFLDKSFIRIAVKSEKDNEEIIKALKDILGER